MGFWFLFKKMVNVIDWEFKDSEYLSGLVFLIICMIVKFVILFFESIERG